MVTVNMTRISLPHSRSRVLLICFAVLFALGGGPIRTARAANGDCGQPLSSGVIPTATDALFILNVAVGFGTCEPCICDTDDSGATTATDALKTLSGAVGVQVDFACPSCEPVSLCDALLSIDTSGDTFDTIDIGQVPGDPGDPGDYDGLWAIVTPPVGDAGTAPVLLDADGNERLMVPLHPDGSVTGGTVDVAITDGIEICPIGSLEILPLPTAPADTSADVLAAFLTLIDALAADFGFTGAELATTPLSQLPSALLPSAVAQIALAGPSNENSFAAMLAGTAPDVADGLDIDLVDRLFAKIGLKSALEELLANRTQITPGSSTVRAARSASSPAQGTCGDLAPVDYEISNAEELSRFMLEGQAARDGQTSLGNQVLTDSLGMIFTTIGLAVPPVSAIGGAALLAWTQQQQATGDLFPALLTKIEFEVENGGRIPEDRMDGGDGAVAPYPEWSDPQLFATNLGMDLSRATLERLIAVLNFLPVPGTIDGELLRAGVLMAVNDALDDFGDEQCRSIPPTVWGPVGEARDPRFVEPLFFGDSVEQVLFEFFQPVALGTTQLRIRTTDAFSGPPVSEEVALEVVIKQVVLERSEITVEPGDPVEVIATVLDSYRPDALNWEYPGFLTTQVDAPEGNVHTLRFDSPEERELFPFEIRAFSTSIKLDPQTPERDDTVQIKTEASVRISPRGGCVSNGSTLDLEAEVEGLADSEDDSVDWSYSGGGSLVPGMNNLAVYTAPANGEGQVTIIATLASDSEVTDEVTIPYGPCDINLDVGWYSGSGTYDPALPADIIQMKSAYYSGPLFPQPGDLLMPPASWSNGSSVMVSTLNGSTYPQTVRDNMGVDHQLLLTSASQIDANLTSASGSAAALTMAWSTSAECLAIPNSANGVECSNGQAQFDWNPVFWLNIAEGGTYEARFTMSCTRNGMDGLHAVGATTRLYRHKAGAAQTSFPNSGTTGPSINGLNPFNAPTPAPLPFPIGQTNHVCEPGAQAIDVQATWELGPPADPSKPDVVAFVITIFSFMVSPVDYSVVFDPEVGSYSQSGTISSSVSIVRTGP